MTSMQDIFGQAGIPWGALTPEEEFGQFARTEFRPGPSRLRSAFYDVGQPLLQQYYLTQPTTLDPATGGLASFADFMGRQGDLLAGAGNYRTLAEQAAAMARMPGAQFYEYIDPDVTQDPDTGEYIRGYEGPALADVMAVWNPETGQYEGGLLGGMTEAQRLLYRQTYGTGEDAAANQARLANLLALQRNLPGEAAGVGLYGGRMGQAITGALDELRGQLLARDPGANFLDWYLQRTGGLSTEGGPGDVGGFL